MLEEELETAIKVVVVGNGAVGKSSMIQRYCKGTFTKEYKKTIGVDFLEMQIIMNGHDVRLMVWDTAGQEEFDAITKAYYRGAQVCVLVFSTVDRESFLAIENWKKKVENEVGEIVMVIVQNKIDLIDEALVTPDEVDSLARKLELKLYRTSVKENFNVDQVFEYLVKKHLKRISKMAAEEMQRSKQTTTIGVFSGDTVDTLSGVSVGGASSSGTHSLGNGGESFQLKPSKQRARRKRQFCTLL